MPVTLGQITSKANRTLGFVKKNVRTKTSTSKVEYASTVWGQVTPSKTYKRKEWCKGGPHGGSQIVIPTMMLSNLGWRSPYRRTSRFSRCFTKYNTALLQSLCHRISSVPLESLATCIPLHVSADYNDVASEVGDNYKFSAGRHL